MLLTAVRFSVGMLGFRFSVAVSVSLEEAAVMVRPVKAPTPAEKVSEVVPPTVAGAPEAVTVPLLAKAAMLPSSLSVTCGAFAAVKGTFPATVAGGSVVKAMV